MTPNRHQRAAQLYHRALKLASNARAAFLVDACGGDEEMRREVESLLQAHERAGNLFSASVMEVAAGLVNVKTMRTGESLAHYQVLALLGAGGMGEVYLALDTRLGRKVALKMLPAAFAGDSERLRRFEQESRAASSLNHPNILTIHEIGEVNDTHYIATEFIEGETLRAIIAKGELKVDETIDIAAQVASALASAHNAGITHRDIKPENIMVRPDGLVKVLDFGLAKLTEKPAASSESEPGSSRLTTDAGVVRGTVQYMSPEQARGLKVDARSDLFSLGVVIYEMIAGHPPFVGTTSTDVIISIVQDEPKPLVNNTPEVPHQLDAVVMRSLRKDREQRYQTAKELLSDLKELKHVLESKSGTGDLRERSNVARFNPLTASALVALLIGAIGLGYYFYVGKRASGVDRKKSIAVLPVKPITTAYRDEIYEIGIADSLVHKISSMRGLIVRSLSATRKYGDIDQDPIAAGQEQQVDYVLASNYQLAGGKIRITAQLLNVANGQIEETYKSEKDTANVFAMQDSIAVELGNILSARFGRTSSSTTPKRGTANEDAYRLFLQGMYLIDKRSLADARKATEIFEQAVRLDANYAPAWAGKAHAHRAVANVGGRNTNIQEEYQKSIEAINKALALDEELTDAHSALCESKMLYEYDFDGAERECKRAIELDPNSSLAHQIYSRLLMGRGRFDEAIDEIKIAIDLEPASLYSQRLYGNGLYNARRYEEAILQFKRVMAMDPNFATTYSWLVIALEMQGNHAEAFEWWMKFLALRKLDEETVQAFKMAYQTSGWHGILRERAKRFDRDNEPYFVGASYHAQLGDKDRAFEYLEKSFQRRELYMFLLKVEPRLDSLRGDPRFDELVKRVGLN